MAVQTFAELKAYMLEHLTNATKIPADKQVTLIEDLLDSIEWEVDNFNESFKGTATTSTNPGTPAAKCWYLASGPGTYTNFGGTVVAQEFATLTWNGSAWVLYEIDITVDMALYAKKTMDADLNANSHKINNLADGVLSTDAVNKGQVDNLIEFKYGYNLYKNGVSEVYAGYINGDGSFTPNASWLTIKNIPVKPSTWYAVYATGGMSQGTPVFYSALPQGVGTFIVAVSGIAITDGYKFQTPANPVLYLAMIVSDANPFVTDLTTLVILEADTNVGFVPSEKCASVKTQLEDLLINQATTDDYILAYDAATKLVKTRQEYRPPFAYRKNLYNNGTTPLYHGYINTDGSLYPSIAWHTIHSIPVKPSTWYAFYATGGCSFGLAAGYTGAPPTALNFIAVCTTTPITDGFKFQTQANATHVGIIVDDTTPFTTDLTTLTLVEGQENIGVFAPVKVVDVSDEDEGFTIALEDILVPSTAVNQQIVVYNSANDALELVTEPGEILNILNSDKILVLGVSSSEGVYEIRNKSFVSKVSNLLDLPIYNRSTSGFRLPQLANKLKSNTASFNDGGIRTIKPNYVLWGVTADYGSESGIDELHYLERISHAVEAAAGLGALSLFRSDIVGNLSLDAMFYKLAMENNVTYHSNLNAYKVICPNGAGLANFYAGGHVGVRTNELQEFEMFRMFSKLPVRKAIKVFRVRSAYKSGAPGYADLNYDTIRERLKYFIEICSGTKALSESSPSQGIYLYDRINESTTADVFNDEYSNMKNGTNVAFSNFALIEFILSKTGITTLTISVKMDVAPTAVYLSKTNDTSKVVALDTYNGAFKVTKTIYDAFSESVGEVFTCPLYSGNLTYAGKIKNYAMPGYWLFFNAAEQCKGGSSGTLTKTSGGATTAYLEASERYASYDFSFYQLYNAPKSTFESVSFSYNATTDILTVSVINPELYMRYDKIKMLISKSGTFNLSLPQVVYLGGVNKLSILKNAEVKESFTEIQTYEGFDSNWITSGLWVNNGAVLEAHSAPMQSYPQIHSKDNHIILDFDGTDGFPTSISKSFTITSSTAFRKAVIRVIARLYPKIYDTTKTPDAYYTNVQQVTPDSYDYGTLICSLKFGALPAGIMKELVDMGWAEITFETYIPPYQTTFDVMLYRDPYDNIDANYKNYGWPLHIYNVSVQVDN